MKTHPHSEEANQFPTKPSGLQPGKKTRVHAQHESTRHTHSATLFHTSGTVTTQTHEETLPVVATPNPFIHIPPYFVPTARALRTCMCCACGNLWENGWWWVCLVFIPNSILPSTKGAAPGLRDNVSASSAGTMVAELAQHFVWVNAWCANLNWQTLLVLEQKRVVNPAFRQAVC